MNTLPLQNIPVDLIDSPFERKTASERDDEVLTRSIRKGGIQQPLVGLETDGRFMLVDGTRRLAIARALGMPKVPIIIDRVPAGESAESYARRIRFVLDEHRQDLLPSQKAGLIVKLKETLGLQNKQVAAYLGFYPDSITNWLAVLKYAPEIVERLDAGKMTMEEARVFVGMTHDGQRQVLKRHASELRDHRKIRSLYSPDKLPHFYDNPKVVKERLQRAKKPRKRMEPDEKKRLLSSYEMKETELAELKAEAAELKAECANAGPVVAAILRTPKIKAMVPAEMVPELERFAEVY